MRSKRAKSLRRAYRIAQRSWISTKRPPYSFREVKRCWLRLKDVALTLRWMREKGARA